MSELTATTQNVPWFENQGQLNLLMRTFAKGATKDQFAIFVGVAKRTGLDPFSKQIYCVIRNGKSGPEMTVQCGIDGYRAIAERSGTLAGIDDVVYDDESTDRPNKATVTVYRIINDTRVSFTASARWNEYKQEFYNKKSGKYELGTMWKKMPYLMLGKCAEALALRKAFPNDLSGIYTTEEMAQADSSVIQAEVKTVQKAVMNGKKEEAKALIEEAKHEPIAPTPVVTKNGVAPKTVEATAVDIKPAEEAEETVEILKDEFGGKEVSSIAAKINEGIEKAKKM